jgi:hypothetical protein
MLAVEASAALTRRADLPDLYFSLSSQQRAAGRTDHVS